ncbi:tRNA N6-adenosine threonylcarbamoyltransferase, mitochondrial [Wickerhamiella sorbophila]|uniref:N(6)-L-threonylcarbamoyladenine synthase n=1 Tax=Wickerhamiella sorbophila TaxID=45607 RepID=A0A2T0FF26_9ASCO|nr:tRNA N6-adenosine threonylcarbamoyltransferase, mitochondrial [Wickerhamiella sorbophila]PRT53603.1 tRNA N6-adenosine threonylcarbamoyltransferase, mitochondrial [Wickerhamiella sorbophila]
MLRLGGFRRVVHRLSRPYNVLAMESSCDDSAVCLIDRLESGPKLVDHRKSTLNSAKEGGIIPIDALAHHLQQLAPLVQSMLEENGRPKIDLVCATQGPGMFSSLAAGLQVAKGLAVAYNVPLIPVHHMLGHLLTPRFFTNGQSPTYPFLSLLVSGGHTMLVLSASVTSHRVLVDTIDIAVGNAVDKCARSLGLVGNMLGKELDEFCRTGDVAQIPDDLNFPLPLEKRAAASSLAFSFAHYASIMPRVSKKFALDPLEEQPEEIRRAIGKRLQADIFHHISRKTTRALNQLVEDGVIPKTQSIDFVCAGGVAANSVLRSTLETLKSPVPLKLHFPHLEWCTDNALMIGWAGIEMYEAGIKNSGMAAVPLAKWPLSSFPSETA